MKATELRIGSLVFIDLSGKPYVVDAIIRDGTPSDTHCGFELYVEGIDYDYAIYAEPIPLTDDWLKKFGFSVTEKNGSMGHFKVYTNEPLTFNTNHGWWLRNAPFDNERLMYVHQLQNLYFALTGDELTLKEQ